MGSTLTGILKITLYGVETGISHPISLRINWYSRQSGYCTFVSPSISLPGPWRREHCVAPSPRLGRASNCEDKIAVSLRYDTLTTDIRSAPVSPQVGTHFTHCFWQALWVHCTEMHTSRTPPTPCQSLTTTETLCTHLVWRQKKNHSESVHDRESNQSSADHKAKFLPATLW